MIEFKDAVKIYPSGADAMNGFTYCFEQGHAYTLFGPSGAGKTTILKAILSLIDLDAGSVSITPGTRISMVFQNDMLLDHLSAWDNIRYGLPDGLKREVCVERISQTAALCQCEGYLGQKTGSLSGGQRQRVSLARALAANPDFLLLDEPFSQLDHALRASLLEQILQLQAQLGFGTIFVSHSFDEAINAGKTILFIKDGKLLQAGSMEALLMQPANVQVARYFSYPGMNLLKMPEGDTACWMGFYPDACRTAPCEGAALVMEHPAQIWMQYHEGRYLYHIAWKAQKFYALLECANLPETLYIQKGSIFRFDAAGNLMD